MGQIYLITNTITQMRYIGATCRTCEERWSEHQIDAKHGRRSLLHESIRTFGPENFEVSILESNVADSDLSSLEIYYIDKLDTFYLNGKGYNMTKGGKGVSGYVHTDATKKHVSESLQGHVFPEIRNKKISDKLRGVPKSESHRRALSNAKKGSGKGKDNPFYGKKHSKKTKEAISNANSGPRVLQISTESKSILHVFKNLNDAGRYVVSNGFSNALYTTCALRIGEVCRSSNKACTAYGFHWRYE